MTQEGCERIEVRNGIELLNVTNDVCNGSVLNVLWKGFHDDKLHSKRIDNDFYDVLIESEK